MADGIDFTFEEPSAPELVLGKKKKKKKTTEASPASEAPNESAEGGCAAASPSAPGGNNKKKKKKLPDSAPRFIADVEEGTGGLGEPSQRSSQSGSFSRFLALEEEQDSAIGGLDDESGDAGARTANEDHDDTVLSTVAKKPTRKKNKKKAEADLTGKDDLDSILAELGRPSSAGGAEGSTEVSSTVPKLMENEKQASSAALTTDGKEGDLDTMLENLRGLVPQPSGEAGSLPMSKSVKNKKKKKKTDAAVTSMAAAEDDDDLTALLAELDAPTTSAPGSVEPDALPSLASPASANPSSRDGEAEGEGGGRDDLVAMMAALDGDLGGGPSGTAKKKKKKTKKSAAKAEAGDVSHAVEGGVASQVGKKSGKKESAAVKRLREAQERKAAEEARVAKLLEEEENARVEEERKEKEKEEAQERARQTKKDAEKARRARLKAEGKLLSKAEAAKRRKAEAFRQQALASGLVPGAIVTVAADVSEASSSHVDGAAAGAAKVVYAKKKRGKPKVETVTAAGAGASPEDEVSCTGNDAQLLEEGKSVGSGQCSVPELVPTPEEEVPDEWDAEPDGREATGGVEDSSTAELANKKLGVPRGADVNSTNDDEEEEDFEDDEDESGEEDDSDSDTDSDVDNSLNTTRMAPGEVSAHNRRRDIRKALARELAVARAARSADDLRSPIVCILGHVDTGKTKILDRIRRTNVQDGEAGGITQQIGASYFPIEAVKKETCKLDEGRAMTYKVPSLLIIDTPGHESFTNLRSRGSSLCDIAILVVDIMHGLEQQTRESIELLKQRKCPFVVLLNKVDRMYDWNEQKGNNPVRDSLSVQKKHVVEEFNRRTTDIKAELQSVGFNTALYWENDDVRRNISLIPTSAITGEGIPDLLMMILSLSQKLLVDRLMYCAALEATVLEVKVIEGLGTTIDIVLTGGLIRAGETIFVVGLDGVIQTSIRALLTPHPMKEMRVKGQYLHHKEIRAAQGIKISADGLDKAVAGTQLLVARNPTDADEVSYLREEVMKDFQTILQNVDKSGEGVYVQASTLGSLEALLEFLRTSDIPVSGINIGPVHKKDIHRASAMLEKRKEFATILAFDVPVEREARDLAEEVDVTIFTADIIYNLFDMFTEHMENHKKQRQEDIKDDVVFPCILKIKPDCIFNKKDPLILGVDVMEGILRVGCPLAVRNNDQWVDIGRVVSLEVNTKSVMTCSAGETVCVKIQSSKTAHITYGRHLTWTDQLVSKMSRKSIDILKSDFRNDLGKLEWMLVIKLKKMFAII